MSIKAHQDNRENTDKFTLYYSKAIDKVCKNTEKLEQAVRMTVILLKKFKIKSKFLSKNTQKNQILHQELR